MFTRLQSFTQHFSKPTQVAWRVLLLLSLVFTQTAVSRADSTQAKPTITPEQAITIATSGEVGENDFRISDMGGDLDYDAFNPAVAYNSADNEFLVVWSGDDGDLTTDGEFEIFGQRLDAATGAEIESDFRISHVGDDGNSTRGAHNPAAVYNSTNNEYLVVWEGDDPAYDDFEIYGRRIEANTGDTIGADFRISDMGAFEGDAAFDAFAPAVAYNSTENKYLVVWHGDDDTGPLQDGEFEIYGQFIKASNGDELGSDFRISDMGTLGSTYYDAYSPAVAFDSTDNQYLVVWAGCDTACSIVGSEMEIYGQRLNSTGGGVGADDFRISHMGPDGNKRFDAWTPAAAYNPTGNEYLVVWTSDDNTGGLVDGESEIFGQRLNAADGSEVGATDFRISDMGPDGDASYDAYDPAVIYNSANGEYLVAWEGSNAPLIFLYVEYEIYSQRLDASGDEIGLNDFRLSDMGPSVWFSEDLLHANNPAVAYNPTGDQYLVVWEGDDNTPPLVDEEFEIFGQRLDAANGDQAGDNDFRISNMDPDTAELANFDAYNPAVAYNSTDNEYLVVWYGDDNTTYFGFGSLVEDESEIFGQRIDAATGAEIGADFRISDMGPDGNPSYNAYNPAVAYNSTEDEYLVVWYGDDTGGLADNEYEIFGQLLNKDGSAIEDNDFRISDMGPDGNPSYDTYDPAVAYNSAEDEYLVVWKGDDNTPPLVDDEFEIFGQLLDADGNEKEDNDFRISDMGPNGNTSYNAYDPAVAYNSTDNGYLVVWWGDDDTGPLVNNEHEVFGQRIEGGTGNEIGADFRISDLGPNGDTSYNAWSPAVAYNSTDNEYLVVWYGDDDTPPLVDVEFEIFGQLLDAFGKEKGDNDFRISDMGPNGDTSYSVWSLAVAYNSAEDEYLVVWSGDDDTPPLVDDEFEIFGQLLDAYGKEKGDNDFRISDMGSDGNTSYNAFTPAVAYNSIDNEYLVVWYGGDDTPPLVYDEVEIFGQRYLPEPASYDIFLPLVTR